MKETILDNLDTYVEKDERAKQMLAELKSADKKTFLLTNSGKKLEISHNLNSNILRLYIH